MLNTAPSLLSSRSKKFLSISCLTVLGMLLLAASLFAQTAPDLTMSSVSGPATGLTGGTITVSNTVAASASGVSANGFSVGIYLSTDNEITTSDILVKREVTEVVPPSNQDILCVLCG